MPMKIFIDHWNGKSGNSVHHDELPMQTNNI